jgi:hypothetical protein
LIKLLSSGVNVAPMLWALHEHPELWDENRARTRDAGSPHHELHDIWARYAAPGVDASKPHEAVWYPCANLLPVRELVYPLMSVLHGDQLGGVLITKIPPGKSCKPHSDPGWHARHYQKFALQIQSHPKQAFHFESQSLVTKPGDLFWFDNQYTHWVTNDSDQDRITMIVCIRTDRKGV